MSNSFHTCICTCNILFFIIFALLVVIREPVTNQLSGLVRKTELRGHKRTLVLQPGTVSGLQIIFP